MSLLEENAAILREMEAGGSDLRPSRPVDFSHVFPNQRSADAFAQAAEREGFSTLVEKIKRQGDPWDATASKDMIPNCKNITDAEEWLHALAQTFQGRADGWGFFGI